MVAQRRLASQDFSLTDDSLVTLRPLCQSFTTDKLKLHSLNHRLTKHFDRVRSLEMENCFLSKKLKKAHEWSNIKAMYEMELAKVRKALDKTAFDKSRLEINNARLIEENEYYKQMLQKQCNERDAAHANEQFRRSIQNEYDSISVKYEKALTNEKQMQNEIAQLNRQLDEFYKALEIETLARIDSENVAQKLRTIFYNQNQAKRSGLKCKIINVNFPEHQKIWVRHDVEIIDELYAENEKLKFIIIDSEAQLRAEEKRNDALENEIVHLRRKVSQLHQKCHNTTMNVKLSFDDKKLAIRDKQRQFKNQTSWAVQHQYRPFKSKRNIQRSTKQQFLSIGSKHKCTKQQQQHIGRMPTTTVTNQSMMTGRSRIAQSFQRLKTILKLFNFDKIIKETCLFVELGKMKRIYYEK